MTRVIKRNGRREAFSVRKLRKSISSAARESDITVKRAREVVRDISRATTATARKRNEIRSRDLRAMVLRKLDATEPAVSRAWRRYDKSRGKR